MNDEEYNVVKENLKNVEFNNLEEDMNIIKGKEPSFKPDDNQNNKNNNKLLIVCFIVIGILLLIIVLFVTGVFKSGKSNSIDEPNKEDVTPLGNNDMSEIINVSSYNSEFINDSYLLVSQESGEKKYITNYEGAVELYLDNTTSYINKNSYVIRERDNKIIITRLDKDKIVDIIKEPKENYGGLIFDNNNMLLGFYKIIGKDQVLYLIDNNSTKEITIRGRKIIKADDEKIIANNGRYIVTVSNDKYGVYDIVDDKELIEPKYDYIKYLYKDEFSAIKDLSVGVINKNDTILIPFSYRAIDYVNGLYLAAEYDDYVLFDSNHTRFSEKVMTGNLNSGNTSFVSFKDFVILTKDDKSFLINKDGTITEFNYNKFYKLNNYLVASNNGSSIVTLFDSKLNKIQDFDTNRKDSDLSTAAIYLDNNFIINNNKLYDMKTGKYRFGVESLTRSYKGYEVVVTINGNKGNAIVKLENNVIGSIENIDLIEFLHADNNGIKIKNNYFILSVGNKNLIVKI